MACFTRASVPTTALQVGASKGSLDHWEWAADFGPDPEYDSGDLAVEHDHACLAVVEVTEDCNLSCSYCFASSGPGGAHRSTEAVEALLDTVSAAGGRPIQFSGGEPTVRDDLPDLVTRARVRGIDHIEVKTNGIRLATENGYAEALADPGVTAIDLQFDGLTSETYEQIREVDLVEEKHAAIEVCRAADLPVVLVPTTLPGVNDHEIGDISTSRSKTGTSSARSTSAFGVVFAIVGVIVLGSELLA